MKSAVYVIALLLLFTVACTAQPYQAASEKIMEDDLAARQEAEGVWTPVPPKDQVPPITTTNKEPTPLIDVNKILGGGPAKDGIPAINNPKFLSVKEADVLLGDDEDVFVLQHKNITRVYPHRIMVWHEIVNDNIKGDPLLITYCPLCGSVIAFERKVKGKEVEFGTSGKLYNSNVVMYDRDSDTLWTQVKGQAVKGALTGDVLKPVTIDVVKWSKVKKHLPNAEVLDEDLENPRPYHRDPYGSYYLLNRLMFPVEHEDKRMHGKTIVHGIEINNVRKAYKEDDLTSPIYDEVGGVSIKIERTYFGGVKVTNQITGKEIIKERDYWFCWFAFRPDTLLYGG